MDLLVANTTIIDLKGLFKKTSYSDKCNCNVIVAQFNFINTIKAFIVLTPVCSGQASGPSPCRCLSSTP